MRLLGYAYTARIKKRGNFGMRESMKWEERGNFPEKKISEGMGSEARDFSEKIFFGFRKYKILRDLSCASRRLPLGGTPPPTPLKRKFCRK